MQVEHRVTQNQRTVRSQLFDERARRLGQMPLAKNASALRRMSSAS
jgi:hypothetical protein